MAFEEGTEVCHAHLGDLFTRFHRGLEKGWVVLVGGGRWRWGVGRCGGVVFFESKCLNCARWVVLDEMCEIMKRALTFYTVALLDTLDMCACYGTILRGTVTTVIQAEPLKAQAQKIARHQAKDLIFKITGSTLKHFEKLCNNSHQHQPSNHPPSHTTPT